MPYKPVDFSSEKRMIEEEFNKAKKGEKAYKKEEVVVQFEKKVNEIEEFIDVVCNGFSPFRKTPIQPHTLLCTKVLEKIKKLRNPTSKEIELFLESVETDLGNIVRNHIKKLIYKES